LVPCFGGIFHAKGNGLATIHKLKLNRDGLKPFRSLILKESDEECADRIGCWKA
jgi:hypothetical protein